MYAATDGELNKLRQASTTDTQMLLAVRELGDELVCPGCNRLGTLCATSHGWWKCYCGTQPNPKRYFTPYDILEATKPYQQLLKGNPQLDNRLAYIYSELTKLEIRVQELKSEERRINHLKKELWEKYQRGQSSQVGSEI